MIGRGAKVRNIVTMYSTVRTFLTVASNPVPDPSRPSFAYRSYENFDGRRVNSSNPTVSPVPRHGVSNEKDVLPLCVAFAVVERRSHRLRTERRIVF